MRATPSRFDSASASTESITYPSWSWRAPRSFLYVRSDRTYVVRQRRRSASSAPRRPARLNAAETARRSARFFFFFFCGGAPRASCHALRARRAALASRPDRAAAIPTRPRPPTGMPRDTSRSVGTAGSFTRTAWSPSTRMTSPAWAGAAASSAAATASAMVRGFCRITRTTSMVAQGCGDERIAAGDESARTRPSRALAAGHEPGACARHPVCTPRPTILPGVRRLVFLLLVASCVLAACGGDDDTDSVENLLDRAFSGEIRSADLRLEAEIEMTGLLDDPIRIEAEGPFRTNRDKLPSADIELRIGSDGGGQTVTSGVLTTGDRAFARFQDVYYEQPRARVREANEAIRLGRDAGSDTPLGELGLDPRSWIGQAEQEDDAEVAGVETSHVSGTLDVESVMRNLNRFVARSGSALGTGGQPAPPRLSEEDIRELTEAVKDPSFDVYVGKEDDIIRRVSGRVEFEIPKRSRAGLGGLDGGSIVFSVEFRDVNGDQEIEAPASARPLSDLTESLGAGGLPGGLGGGEAEPDAPAPPDMPSGGSDGGSDDPEAFRRYAECLDKARPEDTDELQRCAELLEEP